MKSVIITTHKNPDFDGFGAAFAARFLYENSLIVIDGQPARNLAEFLSIYDFDYIKEKEFIEQYENQIKDASFSKIVVVDTADINRIPKTIKKLIEKGIETDIYDHHPLLREKNIIGNDFSRETGSATSLVVEKLLQTTIDLPDIYETLFLIAIHEDTGNFLYTSTTPLEHQVAAELIKRGAKIEEMEEFISLEMTEEQKVLFDKLYNNVIELFMSDINVFISYAEIEKFIGGLNVITHKIFETLTPDVLITVVKMGKNVYLVARSKTNNLDLSKVMQDFNGGGHKKAASAKVKGLSIQQVIQKLNKSIKKSHIPVLKAKNIMSSPVRTALADEKIDKVYEIMDQTGHSGLPVIDKNKLVGIVTKKDLEKSIKHNLSHSPVKSIMARKLKVVDIEDNLSKIRKIMGENDIGRIPVLKDNLLIGIITRTDMLKVSQGIYHSYTEPLAKELFDVFHVRDLMKRLLSKRMMNLLRLLGAYGSEIEMPVYVVGGFVRDLLLNVNNEDIDVVVEGDAIEFGRYVSQQLIIKIVIHKEFNTCSLFMKDGFRIDIATSRTEYYQAPAKLPKVELSTIKKDLYRRDFSINAMAIKLNPENYGNLLDFFNCKLDLEEKIIRILYPLSFVEDPTRIIRAVRFEQRYGFKIDEDTINHLENAVNENYLEKVTGTRLREELEKVLKEADPIKSIRRLGEFKVFSHLFSYTYYTPTLDKDIVTAFNFYDFLKKNFDYYTNKVRKFHILLYVLLQHTPEDSLNFIEFRYGLPKKFFEKMMSVKEAVNIFNNFKENNKRKIKYSDFHKEIAGFNNEQFIYLYSKLSDSNKDLLKEYMKKLLVIKLKVNGRLLLEKGYKGKEISNKLNEIYEKRLDGEITQEEEFSLI